MSRCSLSKRNEKTSRVEGTACAKVRDIKEHFVFGHMTYLAVGHSGVGFEGRGCQKGAAGGHCGGLRNIHSLLVTTPCSFGFAPSLHFSHTSEEVDSTLALGVR